MASKTQWGLQLWGCCTALLAAQDALCPGLLSLAASAIMYAVAKVSPAPFVSTAVTCAQHDWQPRKHIMMILMMVMTKTVVDPACILSVTGLLEDPLKSKVLMQILLVLLSPLYAEHDWVKQCSQA